MSCNCIRYAIGNKAPEVAELRRTAPASAENGPNWHRNYTHVIPGAQGAE